MWYNTPTPTPPLDKGGGGQGSDPLHNPEIFSIQVLFVGKELRELIFGVGGGYFGVVRCISSCFMVSIYRDMGIQGTSYRISCKT